MGAPEPDVGTGVRGGLPDTGTLPMNGAFVIRAHNKQPGECGVNHWPDSLVVGTPCDGGVRPGA